MNSQIWLISSSHPVVNQAKKIFKRFGYDYPIVRASFDVLPKYADEAISKGAKVFISRGNSASLLKQFGLPVVSLRFTYHDFAMAFEQARKYGDSIAIVGYNGTLNLSFEPYRESLGNPHYVYLNNSSELKEALAELKKKGVNAVIGGLTTVQIAHQIGMKAVQIGVEDSSIIDSVSDAQYLLQIELQRIRHMATIDTIFNNVSEAVLTVDSAGKISLANNSARKILGSDCTNQSIEKFIPKRDLVQTTQTGAPQRKLTPINQVLCALSSYSIRDVDGSIENVLTFQQIEQIRELEQNIRKQQSNRHNTAKAHFDDILGSSSAINNTKRQAQRFASSNSSVLIYGETGTGKELFAQSIHNHSPRAIGPFVAINCAALPLNILESELFGYVKGAFTGANPEGRAGYFEQAHMGTIFLDEIGEMPLEIQAKLLRVLQEKEVRRIGDHRVFHIDIRVIAATNRDLKKLVREGAFREDLYYRLAVLELYVPTIKERGGDVILLAEHMLKEIASKVGTPEKHFSKDAQKLLFSMDWDGNVRQIRNAIERLCVLSDKDILDSNELYKFISPRGLHFDTKRPNSIGKNISDIKKNQIASILLQEKGNRSRTAQRLGISKTTLWRRIKQIERSDPDFLELVFNPAVDVK